VTTHTSQDLQRIYDARFAGSLQYRLEVWRVLIGDIFQQFVDHNDSVLDLGCGYGEFIRQVRCGKRFGMDLNPDVPKFLGDGIKCILQDCSTRWPLEDSSLNVVFTSNFFEHLPDKAALGRTLDEIGRCLKATGKLIAMGPNIRFLPGSYWDFWDHYVPLTERSLSEALVNRGFEIHTCHAKFLPYTMARGPKYPLGLLRAYLRIKFAWQIFGKQFLIVAVRR
jgi:SAM-dependent methyltransferase